MHLTALLTRRFLSKKLAPFPDGDNLQVLRKKRLRWGPQRLHLPTTSNRLQWKRGLARMVGSGRHRSFSKTIILAMQLSAIILTMACLSASAVGRSQRVTIDVKNAPIKKVFKEVIKQTGVSIIYDESMFESSRLVTIKLTNAPVEDVISKCLQGLPYTYSLQEGSIKIRKSTSTAFQPAGPPVNLPLPIDITGKITDADGNPLVGASVKIKGISIGATTNNDGVFELKGVDENATLEISYVGYETYTVAVNNRTTIAVSLKIKPENLDEVVINKGYYIERQRISTANIGKVSAEQIEKQPVSNPLAAIQGRVPGLEVIQQTGVPGGNFKVRVRGQNSVRTLATGPLEGNDPLYIIDGVPYTSTSMAFNITSNGILPEGTSPLNSISPADIESIEVLKDADATAIYGSRGSNGVILITTKKGKPGSTKVDFNFYAGASKISRKIDMLTTKEYIEMRREGIINSGYLTYLQNPAYNFIWPDVKTWDSTRNTDWQETLIGRSAHILNAQLALSGGEKNTQYLFSGNYQRETTVFPGDNITTRGAFHLSLNNTSANQRLKTSVILNYSKNNTNFIMQDLTMLALSLAPNAPPLYNANGEFNWGPNAWNRTYRHPLAYLNTSYESNTDNFLSNVVMTYSILKNLNIKTSFGYTDINMEAITQTPLSFYDPAIRDQMSNQTNFSNSKFKNWIIEPQANWRPQIAGIRLDLLVGASFLDQQAEGLAQMAEGFATEALMKNIKAAASVFLQSNYYSQYRYNAVFGRINFNRDDKYIINVTGRRDGSSRFGPGKQFANFAALGAAWIFSKERFFQNAFPGVSYGKIRASYGTSGNDQIGDYQYLDTYAPSGPYQGSVGLAPVRLSNPDFAWEINRKFEVGLDIGIMKDAMSVGISYYRNRSSSQLVGTSLPPTAGFTNIQNNLPATVQNTGVEMEIQSFNIKKSNFVWSTTFNLTIPRNKLIAFPDLENSPEYANYLAVGKPLSIRKLYHYLGVDAQTGLYQFEDVNGDGSFDGRDRQTIRYIGPQFYGGLHNSLQWKGWQLNIFFQFVKQAGNNYIRGWQAPGTQSNQPAFVTERWKKAGDITDIQLYSGYEPAVTRYGYLGFSDHSVSDASFVRLKNLFVSYSLPQRIVKRVHIVGARLFVQGQNILTVTNYLGMDPENQNTNSSLPPLRTLTAGIHLTL